MTFQKKPELPILGGVKVLGQIIGSAEEGKVFEPKGEEEWALIKRWYKGKDGKEGEPGPALCWSVFIGAKGVGAFMPSAIMARYNGGAVLVKVEGKKYKMKAGKALSNWLFESTMPGKRGESELGNDTPGSDDLPF